jgi:uncharacterized DUF497 family protein
MPAQFEWNEAKADSNLTKHGVTFPFATRVFLDPDHLDLDVTRMQNGEQRRKAIGMIDSKLYSVVYTVRGTVHWLISARRTNAKEDRLYGEIHA